jgi:hypothetical protein
MNFPNFPKPLLAPRLGPHKGHLYWRSLHCCASVVFHQNLSFFATTLWYLMVFHGDLMVI